MTCCRKSSFGCLDLALRIGLLLGASNAFKACRDSFHEREHDKLETTSPFPLRPADLNSCVVLLVA